MTCRKWVYAKAFSGEPTAENLQLAEETLPALKDGEIKLEALYLSVDPYMRAYAGLGQVPIGATMIGRQLARVVESKNPAYPEGNMVVAGVGWRTHTVINPDTAQPLMILPAPDVGTHPLSYAIGALGMPGMTTYFGFLEICQPKPGETVLVNGAAGAVGHLVGQLAKLKGCKVVAFAGTDEKCKWLKEELEFDHVFNYKTNDLTTSLKQAAPDGIDCYFDNVGGEFSDTVLTKHMKRYGRISACGSIASYNYDGNTPPGPNVWVPVLLNELTIRGFLNQSFYKDFPQGVADMRLWIDEGKLKVRETVTEGFENMRDAFYSMLKGGNIGKAIIKIKD